MSCNGVTLYSIMMLMKFEEGFTLGLWWASQVVTEAIVSILVSIPLTNFPSNLNYIGKLFIKLALLLKRVKEISM